MYSNDQGDLPESSSDKDVHHERIRMKKTQKYLVKSCYHRIECITTTFFGRIYVEKIPEQCCISYRNSLKTK